MAIARLRFLWDNFEGTLLAKFVQEDADGGIKSDCRIFNFVEISKQSDARHGQVINVWKGSWKVGELCMEMKVSQVCEQGEKSLKNLKTKRSTCTNLIFKPARYFTKLRNKIYGSTRISRHLRKSLACKLIFILINCFFYVKRPLNVRKVPPSIFHNIINITSRDIYARYRTNKSFYGDSEKTFQNAAHLHPESHEYNVKDLILREREKDDL